MGNIIEKLSKILKDKKEIVTNLITLLLTYFFILSIFELPP